MARLEDQISPQELLEAIRGGTLKHDLAKQYRASEKDLAMMLHPLYRRGELSKEEFNDFFKGIPLQKRGAEEPVPHPPDEAPTEFLETFKDKPEASPVEDEKPASGEAAVEAEEVDVEVVEVERNVVQAEAAQPKAASPEGEESSGGTLKLLQQVLTRLEAIENRLTFIERKLHS